jgi:uncharacterized protein (DUF362 family)
MAQQYGNVMVESGIDQGKFRALIEALDLKPPVLIKPNWGTVRCFTEAEVLDWTLSAIPGEKLVIESHGWARNPETLEKTEGSSLTKASLRKNNQWFLEYSGIDKVLEKHQVEYLNLTEEIWAGRVADPDQVKQLVESKYSPVEFTELYSKIPSRIFDLRGGTLLSLAKYKMVFYPLGVSLAIKNQFGLIPGPSRGKFHGDGHIHLDQNIVDINKIYASMFSLTGIIEAAFSSGSLPTDKDVTVVYPGTGYAFASKDLVSLDAFATSLFGRDPESVGHLRLAAKTFGAWDGKLLEDASKSGISVIQASGQVVAG